MFTTYAIIVNLQKNYSVAMLNELCIPYFVTLDNKL